jgi:hypothetical protein
MKLQVVFLLALLCTVTTPMQADSASAHAVSPSKTPRVRKNRPVRISKDQAAELRRAREHAEIEAAHGVAPAVKQSSAHSSSAPSPVPVSAGDGDVQPNDISFEAAQEIGGDSVGADLAWQSPEDPRFLLPASTANIGSQSQVYSLKPAEDGNGQSDSDAQDGQSSPALSSIHSSPAQAFIVPQVTPLLTGAFPAAQVSEVENFSLGDRQPPSLVVPHRVGTPRPRAESVHALNGCEDGYVEGAVGTDVPADAQASPAAQVRSTPPVRSVRRGQTITLLDARSEFNDANVPPITAISGVGEPPVGQSLDNSGAQPGSARSNSSSELQSPPLVDGTRPESDMNVAFPSGSHENAREKKAHANTLGVVRVVNATNQSLLPPRPISEAAVEPAPQQNPEIKKEEPVVEKPITAHKEKVAVQPKTASYKQLGFGTAFVVAGVAAATAVYAKLSAPRRAQAIRNNPLIKVVCDCQASGKELVDTVVTTFCNVPGFGGHYKSTLGALKKLTKDVDISIALVESYLNWKCEDSLVQFVQAEDILAHLLVVRAAVQDLQQPEHEVAA